MRLMKSEFEHISIFFSLNIFQSKSKKWSRDTQQNDIRYNTTQHNHMLSVIKLNVIIHNVILLNFFEEVLTFQKNW